MRQYSFSMMMSFIFLAINQLESFKDHHGLCYFFGTYILLLINIISFLRIVSYIIILFRLYYTILYYCIIYIYDYNELWTLENIKVSTVHLNIQLPFYLWFKILQVSKKMKIQIQNSVKKTQFLLWKKLTVKIMLKICKQGFIYMYYYFSVEFIMMENDTDLKC